MRAWSVLLGYPTKLLEAIADADTLWDTGGGLTPLDPPIQCYWANRIEASSPDDAIPKAQAEALQSQPGHLRKGLRAKDWVVLLVIRGHHDHEVIR